MDKQYQKLNNLLKKEFELRHRKIVLNGMVHDYIEICSEENMRDIQEENIKITEWP